MTVETARTICRMCHGGCGVLAEVRDGEVVGLRGDPENPNNRGFLCAKGRAALEHLHHPDRLRHPLLRVGPRGSGRFERISWDEACERIAARLAEDREKGGPESVVFAQGTDRNYQEWLFRFANAFGSPNVLGPAHVCFYPKIMAAIFSMGAFPFCDYEGNPEWLVVWGSNKVITHGDGVIGTRLLAALKRGTRLIVVDPRRTALAARADHWLRVLPGTDVALALAMIHVVIAEGLFDETFVREHTAGFDELARHVEAYAPERVSGITSVPADLIRAAAITYARARSATIETGTGIEQNRNSFHTARAIHILSALCGNIDRPGGDVLWEPTGLVGRRALPASERLPREQQGKRLGSGRHRLLSIAGWAHPGAVWRAILDREPYPVRSLLVFGSNLLVNYADSERVFAALREVGFLAVSDLFLTPTAAMADLVLPVAGWLERDQIVEHAHYVAARRKLAQVGECRSDEEILNDLAARLGFPEAFWSDVADSLEDRLRPLGLRWRDLAEQAYVANRLEYYKYRQDGFRTPNGRFNFYARGLEAMGYEPLPAYRPVASEVIPPEEDRGRYLLTSCHSRVFFNSEFRQIGSLRDREPDPTLEIHPETARREGLRNGDWVGVSARGKEILLRAVVTDRVAPEVVCASPTWWYPEKPFEEAWRRSNINLLTSEDGGNEEMGSSNFRGISCRIRPAAPP
jgi:anaerobic selenocysteine-containing dehydrogenase